MGAQGVTMGARDQAKIRAVKIMSASVLSSESRGNEELFSQAPSKEGMAVRGIIFGLLLVLPFWLVLGILAVTL